MVNATGAQFSLSTFFFARQMARKPRPSMPRWWWLGQDGCWFCKNRNNCNQCKAARESAKRSIKSRRDKRQDERTKHDADDRY